MRVLNSYVYRLEVIRKVGIMKNVLKNKNVIKAMSLGLSAFMGMSTPISAFASELEDTGNETVNEVTNDTSSESSTVESSYNEDNKETLSNIETSDESVETAQNTVENSVKEITEASESLSVENEVINEAKEDLGTAAESLKSADEVLHDLKNDVETIIDDNNTVATSNAIIEEANENIEKVSNVMVGESTIIDEVVETTDKEATKAENLADKVEAAQSTVYDTVADANEAKEIAQEDAKAAEEAYNEAVNADEEAEKALTAAKDIKEMIEKDCERAEAAYEEAKVALAEAQETLAKLLPQADTEDSDLDYNADYAANVVVAEAMTAYDKALGAYNAASAELESNQKALNEANAELVKAEQDKKAAEAAKEYAQAVKTAQGFEIINKGLDIETAEYELNQKQNEIDYTYREKMDELHSQIEKQQQAGETKELAQLLIQYKLTENGASGIEFSSWNDDGVTVTYKDKNNKTNTAYYDYNTETGDVAVVQKYPEYKSENNDTLTYEVDSKTGAVTYKLNGNTIDASLVKGDDKVGYTVSDQYLGKKTVDAYRKGDEIYLITVTDSYIEMKSVTGKGGNLFENGYNESGAYVKHRVEVNGDNVSITYTESYKGTTLIGTRATYTLTNATVDDIGEIKFNTSSLVNAGDFISEKDYNSAYNDYTAKKDSQDEIIKLISDKISELKNAKANAEELQAQAIKDIEAAENTINNSKDTTEKNQKITEALSKAILALEVTQKKADEAQKAAADAFNDVRAAVAKISALKAEEEVNLTALNDAKAQRDKAVAIYNQALKDKAESENNVKRAEEAAKKAANLAGLDFKVVESITEDTGAGNGGTENAGAENNGTINSESNINVSTDSNDNTDNTDDNNGGNDNTATAATPTQTIVDAQTPLAATPDLITISDDNVALAADITNATSANVSSSSKSVASEKASSNSYTKVFDDSESLTLIEDDDTALAAQVPTITNTDNNTGTDDKSTLTIADEDAPLAAVPIGEKKISWWWLLIIALLGATGYEMYKKHREKQLAEENANNQ
jgi:hypothetical protein